MHQHHTKEIPATNACMDVSTQQQVMILHRITDTQFEEWICAFFEIPCDESKEGLYCHIELYEKNEPGTFLKSILAASCSSYVEVHRDYSNTESNNELLPQVQPEFRDNECDDYFTMTLFKAFFNQLNDQHLVGAQSIDFSKACVTDADGTSVRNTVVFRVNATEGAATYWDLSGTIRPPHKS